MDTKAPSCGRWSCREQELDTPAPGSGEQPLRLEAEGGPASPVWGAEGLPAPACCPSGACQPQASNSSGETIAGVSQQALGRLLPPGMRTGDHLHSVGSQVSTKANGTVDLPNAVLGSVFQHFVTILHAFPAPVQGGALGEPRCDNLFYRFTWRVGPWACRELCPQHLVFPRGVTGDLLRTGDAMAKTYCLSDREPCPTSDLVI